MGLRPVQRLAASWRRRALRVQLLWLLAGVTTLALLALYELSARRLADVEQATSQRWADAVARSAADIAAPLLLQADLPGLEEALRGLAAMPGVLRLEVVGQDGTPILRLESTGRAAGTAASACAMRCRANGTRWTRCATTCCGRSPSSAF